MEIMKAIDMEYENNRREKDREGWDAAGDKLAQLWSTFLTVVWQINKYHTYI